MLCGIACQRGHIVDDARARIHGAAHHLGVARIDGDDRAILRQIGDHRQHPRQLFLDRHRRCARARGLAADIQDVGACLHQRTAMGDGSGTIVIAAAIGETVGRDIHHAHQPRTVQRQAREIRARRGDGIERRLQCCGKHGILRAQIAGLQAADVQQGRLALVLWAAAYQIDGGECQGAAREPARDAAGHGLARRFARQRFPAA